MNQYELVMILTPVLSEDEQKQVITFFEKFIGENGGEIVHQENWGLRQLAFSIKNKTTGIYHLMEFRGPADIIHKLEVQFGRDERLIRFMFTRLDKYSIEYNANRRVKRKEKAE